MNTVCKELNANSKAYHYNSEEINPLSDAINRADKEYDCNSEEINTGSK